MLGVIGGSGFYTFFDDGARSVEVDTPYGNLGPLEQVVIDAIGAVSAERACTHCPAHEGVQLPFELP